MAEHTPTPWKYECFRYPDGENGPEARANIWGDKEAWAVAICEDWASDGNDAAANAAFIVRACNSHDQLMAALQKIADYSPDSRIQPALIARQALAAARGETGE